MIFATIFVWPWKMVSVSVRYLYYQPMDEKIKTGTLRFPAKENPNMERALFDWPMVLQYDVKVKYRFISRKFFGREVFSTERSRNQPKATRVRFRSTNQSNRSISVRLFFLFCSRLFKVTRKSLYLHKNKQPFSSPGLENILNSVLCFGQATLIFYFSGPLLTRLSYVYCFC